MPSPQDILFARFAVDYGLLGRGDVERCFLAQDAAIARGEPPQDFKRYAQELGLLSPYQAAGIEVLIAEAAPARGAGPATVVDNGSDQSQVATSPRSPGLAGAAVADPPVARPASPARDRIRATVGGYTILKEVGRGGMGVVYEAIQLKLNRRVALKVLASRDMDAEGFERHKREGMAAARLTHPNVVQVYDAGEEAGLPYFAMEFVAGVSLTDLVGSPALTLTRAVKLILQAAEGLEAAHQAGIVHRDIKPGNLLVDKSDRLVITDFGLARDRLAVTITQSNQVLGTPRYMSPEQANGVREELDHRTDVYSLGATLYELATGKPIFEDKDGNIFQLVLFKEPKSPRKVNPALPPDLETVILKATAKEASARYATAAEFAEDLRLFLDGRPVKARRAGVAERVWRRMRRNPGASAAAVVATLLFALALGGMALHAARRREAAELVRQARESSRKVEVVATDPATAEEAVHAAHVRLVSAREGLEQALSLDPASEVGWRTLGELCLRMGRGLDAAAACDRLLALRPADEAGTYLRARALRDAQRQAEASAALDGLIVGGRDPVILAHAKALRAVLAGDAEGALRALEAAGGDEGNAAETARIRASALGMQGTSAGRSEAVKAMQASLAYGQGSYRDYMELARWTRESGSWDEAAQALRNAQAHTDEPAPVYMELGSLASLRGDLAEAERQFDRAIERMPTVAMPLLHRAELRMKRKENDGAEADYRKALQLSPGDVLVLTKLLRLYAKGVQGKDAKSFYREVRERGDLQPAACAGGNWVAFLDLIDTLIDLDLREEAASYLEAGFTQTQADPVLFVLRGQLEYRRKDLDAAILDFDRAIAMAPDRAKFYVWRSRCHGSRKDFPNAIRDLSRAIEIDTANRDLYVKRGLRFFQMFDIRHGLEDIQTVTLMSTVDEVEEMKRILVSGGTAEWFEKVDEGMRKMAVPLLPKLAEGLSLAGDRALERGDFPEAQKAFERAKVVDPTSWRPLYGLGVLSAVRGDWDVAAFRLVGALDLGCREFDRMEQEPKLERLRGRAEYQQVKERLKETK